MEDLLKDRLLKARETRHNIVMIIMDQGEILRLIDLIDRENEPKEKQDFEIGFKAGFEQGYQRALVDVIKMLKGMKWYGSNGKKRSDEVFGDPAGRSADMQ